MHIYEEIYLGNEMSVVGIVKAAVVLCTKAGPLAQDCLLVLHVCVRHFRLVAMAT